MKPIESRTRDERKLELTRMWKDKAGANRVLGLLRDADPDAFPLPAGVSVIEAILDHEFDDVENSTTS